MTYDIKTIVETLKTTNDKNFTCAQLSRVVAINEKIARRRMRANASRAKNDQLTIAKRVDATSRANVKYEYALNEKNVELILNIIK
jgi:hypothetical protein